MAAINTINYFLCAFVKFPKVAISFVMSVCPPVRAWNNSVPTEGIFTKFDIEYFSETCPENANFIKILQE
jgi:hypothetical protein